ncbi:MAG TPA: amidohydrolase family protein [Acidothermaceae bacterium]|nr:amidohydrolase family protein [Acidothermaceae bacterium]
MRTVFTGANVFDGTGADPAPADIVVENGKIVEIGSGLDGDESVDLSGQAVLPGMFDCHTHVTVSQFDYMALLQRPFSYQFYQAAVNLRRTLDIGITTIRDAHGADLGVKQAVEDGLIPGPRMQISVTAISQTGGHGDGWMPSGNCLELMPSHPGRPTGIADGPDEIRRKVRELVRAGADVIKVFTSGGVLSPRDDPRHAHFRLAELEALVEEATAAGIYVMSHAQGADGIKNAVRAGIRSIEHGIFLDDEGISLMLERGTWLVPTLSAPQAVIDLVEAGGSLPEAVVAKAHAVIEIHRLAVRRAIEAGVKVAMGTDSGVGPHGSNLREVELMTDVGLSPAQALVATTSEAARLLDVADELGTIEPGKRGDLVVIDGDPLDVKGLGDRVRQVWKDGVRVDSAAGVDRR